MKHINAFCEQNVTFFAKLKQLVLIVTIVLYVDELNSCFRIVKPEIN